MNLVNWGNFLKKKLFLPKYPKIVMSAWKKKTQKTRVQKQKFSLWDRWRRKG